MPSCEMAWRLAAGSPEGTNEMAPALSTPSGTVTITRLAVNDPTPATVMVMALGLDESMAVTLWPSRTSIPLAAHCTTRW